MEKLNNKINVDGVDYEFGGSSKLYKHLITIHFEKEETGENGAPTFESLSFNIEFITESETPITQQQFVDYINNYPYPQFSGTKFWGTTGAGVISQYIANNYYGNHNFQVEKDTIPTIYEDGNCFGMRVSMNLGSTFGDYINYFEDKVTPFITEV